ncbi:hypothetical protein GlitD10_2932 [Gloeomargarita lithophora Alchichica-D10]|uniref:Uncharacterized protein n=1 Tax=Gloeomargarita lithophora Alchichica-D10 TaxID=1188229 RepID=A0A1J0AH72_9CYAN|nr:hypothetical protein GlitD10_2932 [Gloeomargarita lithophora Alchichica-D10]
MSQNLMQYTTRRCWQCYNTLPESIQRTADDCYELLKADPSHPFLHFKGTSIYLHPQKVISLECRYYREPVTGAVPRRPLICNLSRCPLV